MRIGCDIVKIDRIQDPINLAKRILSDKELNIFVTYSDDRQKEFLAGRFAAREAIIKALPVPLKLKEIEIDPVNIMMYKGYKIQVSISHDGGFAMAMALVIKENDHEND